MNVYEYIAEANPDGALKLCNRYGFFQINNQDELATCLLSIVAQDGNENAQNALKEVMELHPDKDTIIELFDKKKDESVVVTAPVSTDSNKDCGCSHNKNADGGSRGVDATLASGGISGIANQTNTYIIVAALIISLAVVIGTNKK